MIISLVVAASKNHAIGKDNRLLWHLPNDMKFFKNTTWALPVILGRKTFESMDSKPLNGRLNIIITRQKDWKAAGVTTVHSLEEAIKLSEQEDYKECCVIGGGEIFREAMSLANRIYFTLVDATIEGDVFFPAIDPQNWQKVAEQSFTADAKHAYPYHFQRWERKQA